jgi:hypothetical protein
MARRTAAQSAISGARSPALSSRAATVCRLDGRETGIPEKSVIKNKAERGGSTVSGSGSVQRSGRCRVSELLNGGCDPAPGVGAGVIAIGGELVSALVALLERFVAVALQHQSGGAPDIDLGITRRRLQAWVDKHLTPIIARPTKLCVKVAIDGGGIDPPRIWYGALLPSAPMSTSMAASASGSNRQRRSCGSTESSSGRGGSSAGRGRRNPLACSERALSFRILLRLTFAAPKLLNGLAPRKASKAFIYGTRAAPAIPTFSRFAH